MRPSGKYCGIHKDINGGMTAVGKIIRDAQVFGLLDEAETCEDWDLSRLYALLDKINAEWDKYGCMVSQLPDELFKRHQRIHSDAIAKAEAAGWCGEDETDSDSSDT